MVPYPRTRYGISHRAPVTYNYNPGRGGILGIFSSSAPPFVSGAAPPHPLSLSDEPWYVHVPKRSILIVPIRRLRLPMRTSTTQTFARGLPCRRQGRGKGRLPNRFRATSCSAALSGYFQIKKRETKHDKCTLELM
jgi:hypothetical protein